MKISKLVYLKFIFMNKKISSCLLFLLIIVNGFAQNSISTQPVYVIVHGAWGGSWAFKKVDSILTSKGALVYRPSLTGQGERVHLASKSVGLQTHIDDVVNTILYEELTNVILVGHSYGGMVITGVANKIPERIKKIIYLDAFLPEDGESVKTMKGENWSWFAKMEKDGFMVPPWLSNPLKVPGDVPHPVKTLTDPIILKNPLRLKIPGVYILTVEKGKNPLEDDFAKQAERARMKNFKMLQLESDHNPQWSAVFGLVGLLLIE